MEKKKGRKQKIIDFFLCLVIVILIGVGSCLLFYAGYAKYETYNEQKRMKQQFEQVLKDNTGAENEDNKEEEPDTKKEETNKYQGPTPIAMMNIPKIKLEVAVGEGVGDDVLKYAVGHFKDTAEPGQTGNFAVAGHRNFTYAEYFKDLDKLQNGDKIYVTDKNGTFTYVVNKSFIVEPSESYVLDETEDATITLVTCTIGAKQRLIIQGKLELQQ